MSKVFDLSICVCSNCKFFEAYKSNPTMGKCCNPQNVVRHSEMNENSNRDEFRLKRVEANK